MHKRTLITATLGLALLTMRSSAAANFEPADVLTGLNGKVTISEYNYSNFFLNGNEWANYESGVGYAVNVIGTSVAAFAISHDREQARTYTNGFADEGWGSGTISAAVWNSPGRKGGSMEINGVTYSTSALGLFSDLFGTVDTHVSVFNNVDGIQDIYESNDMDTVTSSNTPDDFNFLRLEGLSGSEFIALDRYGNVVDGSFSATAVPEPSSAVLIGLGALGLTVRRKRQ